MSNRAMIKLIALFFMLLLFIPVSGSVYFLVYKVFNMHPETYYRYATNGAIDRNLFYDEDIDIQTNIFQTMDEIIDWDSVSGTRKQDLYKALLKDKENTKIALYQNSKYIEYLTDKSLTVDDFIGYMEKIVALDDNYLRIGFFVAMLLICWICVVKLEWRKAFYFFAGAAYVLFVFSQFTGMQLDSYIYYSFFSESDTHNNFIESFPIFLEAMIQAILTFIILDFIFQQLLTRKTVIIGDFIDHLDILLDMRDIKAMKNNEVKAYISKQTYCILKLLKKEKRRLKPSNMLNKLFSYLDSYDKETYELICEIEEKIQKMREWHRSHDKEIKEVRHFLKKLKMRY